MSGDIGRVAHDVVAVVDGAHLVVVGERTGRLEFVRIPLGFLAEPLELRGDHEPRRDTGDVVAVSAPSR